MKKETVTRVLKFIGMWVVVSILKFFGDSIAIWLKLGLDEDIFRVVRTIEEYFMKDDMRWHFFIETFIIAWICWFAERLISRESVYPWYTLVAIAFFAFVTLVCTDYCASMVQFAARSFWTGMSRDADYVSVRNNISIVRPELLDFPFHVLEAIFSMWVISIVRAYRAWRERGIIKKKQQEERENDEKRLAWKRSCKSVPQRRRGYVPQVQAEMKMPVHSVDFLRRRRQGV